MTASSEETAGHSPVPGRRCAIAAWIVALTTKEGAGAAALSGGDRRIGHSVR
jgi:hypothetical protein